MNLMNPVAHFLLNLLLPRKNKIFNYGSYHSFYIEDGYVVFYIKSSSHLWKPHTDNQSILCVSCILNVCNSCIRQQCVVNPRRCWSEFVDQQTAVFLGGQVIVAIAFYSIGLSVLRIHRLNKGSHSIFHHKAWVVIPKPIGVDFTCVRPFLWIAILEFLGKSECKVAEEDVILERCANPESAWMVNMTRAKARFIRP
jgi:hypothetical protein